MAAVVRKCARASPSQNQLHFPLKYDLLCKNTNKPGAAGQKCKGRPHSEVVNYNRALLFYVAKLGHLDPEVQKTLMGSLMISPV